jgi:hypothetical protein
VVKSGHGTSFPHFDLAPPEGGWHKDGRLRIQLANAPSDGTQWTARFNGTELSPTNDVSEPFANPYPPMLGKPENMRAWTVPARLPQDGSNLIEFTLKTGADARLEYLDLAFA